MLENGGPFPLHCLSFVYYPLFHADRLLYLSTQLTARRIQTFAAIESAFSQKAVGGKVLVNHLTLSHC